MAQELVRIKSLSCQASTLTMNENQELIQLLLEEMKKHSKNVKNPKHHLGTLLYLLDPLLDQEANIKQKIQHQIDQYNKNNNKSKSHEQTILSSLPENVFDLLGPFLTLHERIQMRFLNKFFYQEFTNSKLSQRRQWNNDNYLIINRSILHCIELQPQNSLRYQYPIATAIDLGENFDDTRADLLNDNLANVVRPWFTNERHKQYWNTFFEYCNDLWIKNGSINILEFIPISILFNQQISNEKNRNTNNNIDICIEIEACNAKCHQSFAKFNDNYTKYLKHECNNCNDNIRSIGVLGFVDIQSDAHGDEIKSLMQTLKGNFLHLAMWSCRVSINSIKELNTIFHPNLKTLKLHNHTDIHIDKKLWAMDNHHQCCNIHTLYLSHCYDQCYETPYDLLRLLSKLEMLNKVTQIEINLEFADILGIINLLEKHHGWLHGLLNADNQEIQCPQIKHIYINCVIRKTRECETIIQQIHHLGKIANNLCDSVEIIVLNVTVAARYLTCGGAWLPLAKDTIPLSSAQMTETLNQESIEKVCQQLERWDKQWNYQKEEQFIQIEFKCNNRAIDTKDMGIE